jgi:SpoVK/Ycf46/Vps4 family AAA+-type ATPase
MTAVSRRRTRAWCSSDDDESFVRCLLAQYLARVLSRGRRLDQPTLEFFVWLLDGELGELPGIIRRRAKDEAREQFDESLGEAEDNDDLARAVRKAVGGRPVVRSAVIRSMRSTLARLGKARSQAKSSLGRNVERLRQTFQLSNAEAEVCLFIYVISTWQSAENFFENHLQATTRAGRRHFATAVGLPMDALARALVGKARRVGIIDDVGPYIRIGDDFLPFFSGALEADLYRGLFQPARAPAVPLDAHFVEGAGTEHLLRILRARSATRPVHILLYGAPGTGKTSYARGLAQAAGVPAFEVLPDKDNKTVSQRAALLACLNLTNHGSGSIVIVDEADSLLNTELGWLFRGESQDKGWLNHLLEEPGVRMIWIANRVEGIADSVRRRFAYSQAFRPFGRKQRVRVWETVLRQHHVQRLVRPADLVTLAAQYPLSNGAIESAVCTAKASGAGSREVFQRALRAGLDAHRTLLAGGRAVRPKDELEQGFVLEALHVSEDVPALLRRLERVDQHLRHRPARRIATNILFHGPPGTGKSELARHIAHRLDREPLVRRASDILGMYVGEAEKALAAAFAEAEREDSVLILDEVDTFLYARSTAVRSWEVSLVNELLTQMERFRGLMIATTNRLDGLDPACLRRFQVKVRFDYLTDEGKRALFQKMLSPLVGEPAHVPAGLDGLTLAAGDFRVVRDRYVLEGRAGAAELLDALAEEARARSHHEGGRAAGFVAR